MLAREQSGRFVRGAHHEELLVTPHVAACLRPRSYRTSSASQHDLPELTPPHPTPPAYQFPASPRHPHASTLYPLLLSLTVGDLRKWLRQE